MAHMFFFDVSYLKPGSWSVPQIMEIQELFTWQLLSLSTKNWRSAPFEFGEGKE